MKHMLCHHCYQTTNTLNTTNFFPFCYFQFWACGHRGTVILR